MKKVPLILAILLLVGSGYGFLRAYENYNAAAGYQKLTEEWMTKLNNTQDMAKAEEIGKAMDGFKADWAEHKQAGMMHLGGGVVLLVVSIILFIKSRRPKKAA